MQDFRDGKRPRIGKAREDFAGGGLEGGQRSGVGHQIAGRRGHRGEGDAAIDLAAGEASGDRFAHRRLQRPQFLGDPRLELEVAVVHGLQLDREASLGAFTRRGGKSGHAGDHLMAQCVATMPIYRLYKARGSADN